MALPTLVANVLGYRKECVFRVKGRSEKRCQVSGPGRAVNSSALAPTFGPSGGAATQVTVMLRTAMREK